MIKNVYYAIFKFLEPILMKEELKNNLKEILNGGIKNKIKGVNKIILNFNLVLDRKYCDNKIIEYEDDPDKDGYVLPIEEQRKISSLFYLDSGTEIDEICLFDSDMKELNRYEIYSSANKKVNPDERIHYMRRNFSDSIISIKLNVLLKDAMIDNQLNHYANKYLKDNNIE